MKLKSVNTAVVCRISLLTREENRIGEIGFVSVLQCTGCYRRVETFSDTPDKAAEKCLWYWNHGAYDN